MGETTARLRVLPLVVAALFLTAGKKSDGLDEVFAAFEKVETIQGSFVQYKKLAAFEDVQEQKGYFKSDRDGRVLFVVTDPVSSIFAVVDGRVLVRYPDLDWEEVTDLDASPTIGAAVESILAVLGTTSAQAIRDSYEASVKKHGKKGWTVSLVPRDAAMKKVIEKIVMRVHPDARVSRIEIREVSGDSTTIEFSDIVFDEPIDDPLFDF